VALAKAALKFYYVEILGISIGAIKTPKQPKKLPARPKEVKEAYCTNDKARRLLGYEHKTEFYEGLAKMWAWAKAKGGQTPKYVDTLELEAASVPETWKKKLM